MKILNLDQFAEVKRQVTLKGVSHDITEVTVQDFANNMTAAEQLEKAAQAGEVPAAAGIDLSVLAIRASVPSLPEAEIRALPFVTMGKLLQFIRGDLDPDVVAPAPAAAAEGAAAEGADAKKG